MRSLGKTGIFVSCVGLGAGPLGDASVDEHRAQRVIEAALAMAVNVVDTAPSYGQSEERIGRALHGRRDRVVLITKGGYGVEGVDDWTPECIARGVDRALRRLRTDRLDVFLLHSCDRARLERGDLFAPLLDAKKSGKTRAIGYSGDGEALDFAVGCGVFDVVECSVNAVDQRALAHAVPHAKARGLGVLAKRSMANAAFRHDARPARDDVALYWDRLRVMFGERRDRADELLRFAAHAPGVDCALVGTTDVEHLARAVAAASLGPPPTADAIRARFSEVGASWQGVV